MSTKKEILAHYIDAHREEAVELLKAMVQKKSIQGNEAPAQQIVISYLEKLGLPVDVWDIDPEKLASNLFFLSERKEFSNSPNVAAVLKGSGGGRSILLNGHIDVVPEGDLDKWSVDPYGGIVKDGKMYGRGTTDMKGGSVSLLMAMEAIINSGITLKGDVIFESVIEEESGGAGTLDATLRNYVADAAIIPEPTCMKLFIKQQGSMWFRISIDGRSAHGGTRYEGVSALEKAWLIHRAILNLEESRNSGISDPLYQHVPIPLPINVGKITGGNWPSSVPDLVILEGRIGVGPEEEIGNAKKELTECIEKVCATDQWLKTHPAKVEFFGGQWVPNSVSADHPFVATVSGNFKQMFQEEIVVEASPWGTDAGILGAQGGITTLVIGPGETRVAHYPDEYIEIDKMIEAAKLFAGVIVDWCEINLH
jgi:acetylornithine deacetylase